MKKKSFTNIFLSKETFNDGFPVTLFEIIGCTDPKSSEDVARWFNFKHHIPASHFVENGTYYLAVASNQISPPIIHCDEYHFELKFIQYDYKLSSKYPNEKRTVENLMYRVIESHNYKKLRKMIWTRNKSQRIYCESETELVSPENEIQLFSGYKLSIEYLSDQRIGLVLDSTISLVEFGSLFDRLKELGKEQFEEDYNCEYVIFTDEKGTKKPRFFVKIRDGYDIDTSTETKYGKEISLREKYSNINSINGSTMDEDLPVAEIKLFEKDANEPTIVPLCTLQYSPDFDDLKDSNDMKIISDEIYTDPNLKYTRILRYLKFYSCIEVGKYLNPIYLNFNENNRLSDLNEMRFPSLKFGSQFVLSPLGRDIGKEWRFAKVNNLKDHGYYKKPRLDKILLIKNDFFNNNVAIQFKGDLVKQMNEWHLNYNENDIDILPIQNISNLDKFLSQIQLINPGIRYGAILILNDKIMGYKDQKDCLNKYQIPSQGIKERNCDKKTLNRNDIFHSILENTIAGLIGKCNGIPWILDEGLSSDFYIGLDSGGPEKQRSWSCAYVFDEHGEKIYQREPEHFAKEALPDEIFKSLIIETVDKKVSLRREKVNKLIIHRDGFLPNDEMIGLKNAIDELKRRDTLETGFSCFVVNIRKTSNFRIFNEMNHDIRNPIIGTYMLLDENRAILANTGFPLLRQSTTRPLLIEVLSIYGVANIEEIIKDVFHLSELNWGSPMTGFKMPITIYYAEKMIDFAHFKHKPTHLTL